MFGSKRFFSFISVVDPVRHRDYNAWHQLDHVPENLALDGVAYGERWVQSPGCREAALKPAAELAAAHYVATYWFRDPAEASILAWQELAERSFQWGRRPDRAWVERPLMGFFGLDDTKVSPRLRLSPQALPMRPKRGVFVEVLRLPEAHGDAAEAAFRWYDEETFPARLAMPGVAGVQVFSGDSTTLDRGWEERAGTTTFDVGEGERGQIRVHLYFLDDDPIGVAGGLTADAAPRGVDVLFGAPLETIVPWGWDWFTTT